ncbi:energy transducer TonB [Polaribacter sp. Z022]|uniref:energy transducer TonB n=1 Tax=Polaribacter sp. Z022 TaxID=2927125 RepID=UPI002021A37F|nr:energy transducer TonB [Polaribacter sp. Z022]MCL7753638.1 energy transducer TonB [Polaribacter sp. Z022]
MRIFILSLILIFNILSTNAQDKKDIAKVYFKRAKISFKENDFIKTEKYLEKTTFYNEGILHKEIAIFGANFYFKTKKYKKAKEYLTAYFKLEKNKKTAEYTDMLVLYTDTLDAITNSSKPIKETKKVIPVVNPEIIKKPIKEKTNVNKKTTIKEVEDNSEEEEGSNSVNESTTTNEELDSGLVKDVPFLIIENVPVFPGCSGSKTELRDCFSKKVQYHFSRKFNADLPNKLGLSAGRKRVLINFTIKRTGFVEDIVVRAPHPAIKNEVIRVMELLPKMKPGTQRGKNVNVKYGIPFTLIVDGIEEKKE